MLTNYKVFGFVVVAFVVMTALAAPYAQAQGKFTWEVTTALTAEQAGTGLSGTQVFGTTSGNTNCKEVQGEASVSGSEGTQVTAENISYQSCTGPFGETATVNFNGCHYLLTVGQTIGQTGMETTGQPHIQCPAGKQITITGAGGFCQIHIPAQTPTGGHVIYRTVTGLPYDVKVEATVTGIQYQGTTFCTGGTNGTYTGNITIRGYQGSLHDASHETSIEVH